MGPKNFELLLRIFSHNTSLEVINVADSKIDTRCAVELSRILERTNDHIRNLYFRNSRIGDEGALAVASLIQKNKTIVELEIFNCGITEKGGSAIGDALRTNFCIEKLSIGENSLNKKDVEQIQQSVIFNTQYNQMKKSNEKFDAFAPELIAKSLKRWAQQSTFVAAKLQERLQVHEDEMDFALAKIMLDKAGKIDLKPVPTKYEYSTGDG